MMYTAKIATIRLEKVLSNDRQGSVDKTLEALKGDLYEILSAYADVASDTVQITIENENGLYHIKLTAKANRINGLSNINKI